jgi:hypothetical protein
MLSLVKFSMLLSILCLVIVTSGAFAAEVELPANTIVLEAEEGNMEAGVTIIEDDDASGGKATDHERGIKTEYEIEIPEAGDWYLWVRIWCPDGGKDSYWIGMDKVDGSPSEDALGEPGIRIFSAAGDSVNMAAQPFNIWFWDCNKSHADPHSFFKVKSSGKYVLWTKGREPGTLIDQILLTLDQTFNPEEASKGESIDIFQAVYPKDKLSVTWGEIKN